MLVLSRKTGEAIRVGADVWIRVLDIGRGRVRLGIEAPSGLPIHRHELLARPEMTSNQPGDHGPPPKPD